MKSHLYVALSCFICFLSACSVSAELTFYPKTFTPNTVVEARYLLKNIGSTVSGQERTVPSEGYVLYAFPATAGALFKLSLTLSPDSALPRIAVLDMHNKPLPFRLQTEPNGVQTLQCRIPPTWPFADRLRIRLGAKSGSFTIQQFVFQENPICDPNSQLPIGVLHWLSAANNLQALTFPWKDHHTDLLWDTIGLPTPQTEPPTSAVQLPPTNLSATAISAWKSRDFAVFSYLSTNLDPLYFQQHPTSAQVGADGKPILFNNIPLLEPLASNLSALTPNLSLLASQPLNGVTVQALPYLADAAFSSAFQTAWQQSYHAPWQPPTANLAARYHTSSLMAQLDADFHAALLQQLQSKTSSRQSLLMVPDPLTALLQNEIVPWWQILHKAPYDEIGTLPNLTTLLHPIWLAGDRRPDPFYNAYLIASWLQELTRGLHTTPRFSLLLPAADTPTLSQSEATDLMEQQTVAALLGASPQAFSLYPLISPIASMPNYQELLNILSALNAIGNYPASSDNLSPIGLLIGDGITYQGDTAGALDDLYALTLPILSQGIPCALVSLERSVDPGYLAPYKVLILTCDPQKPVGSATMDALANWVQAGGVLIVVGGSNAYNDISDAWWRQASFETPVAYLWHRLGLQVGPSAVVAPPQEANALTSIATYPADNPRIVRTLNLTPYLSQNGSVAVRFTNPDDTSNRSALVHTIELRVGNKVVAAFLAGSEVESYFLVYNHGSDIVPTGRIAPPNTSWTYQFDHLPTNQHIELLVDCEGPLQIAAGPTTPDYARGLLSASQEGDLTRFFPRFHPPYDCTITSYSLPSGAQRPAFQPLYLLRNGTSPIWMAHVNNGIVLQVGLSPRYFAANELSASLLRTLLEVAAHHARLSLPEHNTLVRHYGPIYAIRTFNGSYTLPGRSLDLFSSSLEVRQDRVIPPHTAALLLAVPSTNTPALLFTDGRLLAESTAPNRLGFLVAGPAGTQGLARVATPNRPLLGVKAIDLYGDPVPVQVLDSGDTLLLIYPNDPDGVAIRVHWK